MSQPKETVNPRKVETSAPDTPSKKPYTTPRLTIYGSIEKLTKTGGQTTRDGGGGKKRH
jgi:hypothetical protein